MDELNKLKKKIKKDFEEHIEIDEDSDHPVHEKFTKEKKIKK
mgnify:FL=1|jgi:hypothetical protein